MTALNMARHRNNPNFKFWKMLKQGYDDFEATHQEPKVAVCEKRYVFDAAPLPGHQGPLRFSPHGKCPAFQLDPMIASAVTSYRRQQEVQMASYISRRVAEAPPHQGDGGMNPVFAQQLGITSTTADNNGRYSVANLNLTPGAMPNPPGALPHVPNPPGTTIPKVGAAALAKKPAAARPAAAPAPASQPVMMASVPMPEPAPQAKEGKPMPEHQPSTLASLFGNLFSAKKQAPATAVTQVANADDSAPVKLRGTNTTMAAKHGAHAAKLRTASTPVAPHSKQHAAPATAVAKAAPANSKAKKAVAKAESAQEAQSPWEVADQHKKKAKPEPEIRTAFSTPSRNGELLSGAQPVMPTGSFNSRWSSLR